MRVLFFIESLGPGGKERRLTELIYDLVKNHNYECALVLTKNEIHYTKLNQVSILQIVLERKYKKDIGLFYKFYKVAKEFKPDIIHVWGNMVATYAIPAKITLGIPLVNSQITDAPNFISNSLNCKLNFFFSNAIISNSKAGLVKYNVKEGKGKVIYNGFNFDRIRNLEDKDVIKQKFNISTGKIVGMVATFSDSKDYKTYLFAAQNILRKNKDVTFLCVGSGESDMYQKMVSNEFQNRIIFTGPVKEVESLMSVCNVGVLTSFGEGISNAILEFMALSKPVIATNLGGNPELIENGKSGYLISVGSVSELTKHLEYFLNNTEQSDIMGSKGFEIVNKKFGMERMTREFIEEYKKMIQCVE